jgi:hypothetical protein
MNSTEKILRCAVGMLLLAATVQADTTESKDNPWRVIIDRNPFGLQDPPPPPDPSSLTNQPPVKIDVKFTGVSSDSNSKRAWLMIPPGPGRPQPKYLSLSEGDSDGDLKVLEINETETTVKVLNAGVPVTLNFKEHGLAAPVAPVIHPGLPGAAPVPGVVPAPGIPPPGIRTAAAAPYAPQPSVTPGTSGQPSANPSLRTIPARNLRTTPVEPQQQVDPAVQYLQMKVQEERARREGIPHPPIPPLPGVPSQ